MGVLGKGGSEEASADRPCKALALHDPVVPMVEVEDLTAGYGRIVALREVCLVVDRGEMMAVVGPNGSGKSTLLRVLSGVLTPTAGRVRIAGRDLSAYPRRRLARMTAVVPQETSTDFSFSVDEVVLMGRAPHLGRLGFPGEHDLSVAREAMARMGVEHLCGRGLQEISGGERQRVIIARALVQEPEILLLDEPTSHLDIRHQVEIYDLMAELNAERGITIVSVLHDLNLAAMYFRRVAVLSEGTVHSIGPSAEVLTYATIKAVYGTEVYVALNDVTGAVNILPLSRPYRERLRLEPQPA